MPGFSDRVRATPFGTRCIIILCSTLYILGYFVPRDHPLSADNAPGFFCIWPRGIVESPELWYRFFTHVYFHGSLMHILFNLLVFYGSACALERQSGSLAFLNLIFVYGISTSVLYMMLGIGGEIFGFEDFYNQCAVGFSGVIFALITMHTLLDTTGNRSIFGFFTVPAVFYPWALLVVQQIIMPNVSFLGHLCGILAGYLHNWGWLNWFLLKSPRREAIERSCCCLWITRAQCYIDSVADANNGTGNLPFNRDDEEERPTYSQALRNQIQALLARVRAGQFYRGLQDEEEGERGVDGGNEGGGGEAGIEMAQVTPTPSAPPLPMSSRQAPNPWLPSYSANPPSLSPPPIQSLVPTPTASSSSSHTISPTIAIIPPETNSNNNNNNHHHPHHPLAAVPPQVLQELVEMGFDRNRAIAALIQGGGRLEDAVNLLARWQEEENSA